MKTRELVERLLLDDPQGDMDAMILDGFNGGGVPREINFGPTPCTITQQDADKAADCEGMVGEHVLVLGYGFY
jgi:hypothetical protein